MTISLIHPSRGRNIKSLLNLNNWLIQAKTEIELIVSIDSTDPDIQKYKYSYPEKNLLVSDNKSAVDAINNAAKVAKGDILIVVSDDTECPINWGPLLLNVVRDKTDWILKTQDGTQPWIITMPIMDRTYYNRFGYIYYPEYRHMFCDTELTCVADITGRKITSNLLFKHNHYSVTKEPPDAVNKRADATWDQGEKLFLERYKRNFDLPPGGKIQDNGMIEWLKRKVK